jgi:hypothetical protein
LHGHWLFYSDNSLVSIFKQPVPVVQSHDW